MKADFVTALEAAKMIKDNYTIATIGMTLVGASESILKATEKSFLETGSPRNLTLVHSAGQSDRKDGIQHFAHEGFVTRLIGSHWGLQPRWMEMIANNKVEAYCLPQGQIAQLYSAMASGLPGKISKVGLGTFIDPRIEGGKMNERTKKLPELVDLIHIKGEEYLFYNAIPLNIVIIRGTTADEMGNISTEDEAMKLELLPAVFAAKRFGGKVIAQVKRVAQTGTIHPKKVVVPGVFVDAVVVCDNPTIDHRQTSSWYYDPAYSGDLREPSSGIAPIEMSIRKMIARRAMTELSKNAVINLGTGIPNDTVGFIAAEEDILDDIVITVESGIYGGVQAGGINFGIGKNLFAMIEHQSQFEFYNGAGADFTFMGAGEMDIEGNVNSTKMGDRCTGAGGFIDITQSAKCVLFCSTFTASGLEVNFEGQKLNIIKEGSIKKLVKNVRQISYNGRLAREKGQKMFFVTERAVFELRKDGPVLIEIAPGVDLEKDVLDQMEFAPIIDKNLKTMDSRLFLEGKFGLKGFLK